MNSNHISRYSIGMVISKRSKYCFTSVSRFAGNLKNCLELSSSTHSTPALTNQIYFDAIIDSAFDFLNFGSYL